MKNAALIAYDIVNDKKRRKAFNCLRSWQLNSQYSVFECRLNPPQSEELLLQLCNIIDDREDKLLFIWLDKQRIVQSLTKKAAINFKQPSYYIS